MVTFFIILAACAIFGVLYDDEHRVLCGIGGGMFGFVSGLVAAAVVGWFLPQHMVLDKQIPLAAFHDGTSMTGSFLLGSGSVDKPLCYYYFTKTHDAGYDGHKLCADGSVGPIAVLEEKRTDGALDVYRYDFDVRRDYYFGLPSSENDYLFRIPKGSLLGKFLVN